MSGAGSKMPPNNNQAQSRVQRILKICAPTNTMAGRPPCILTRSENFASSPIETNAKANHAVRRLFKMPPTCLMVPAGTKKENTKHNILLNQKHQQSHYLQHHKKHLKNYHHLPFHQVKDIKHLKKIIKQIR